MQIVAIKSHRQRDILSRLAGELHSFPGTRGAEYYAVSDEVAARYATHRGATVMQTSAKLIAARVAHLSSLIAQFDSQADVRKGWLDSAHRTNLLTTIAYLTA